MKKKTIEPEIRPDGIWYPLGGPYWVLFVKVWGSTDADDFLKSSATKALRMIVDHTVDWNIPDKDWKPIPFEKDKLLGQIDAYENKQKQGVLDALRKMMGVEAFSEIEKLAQEQPSVAEVVAQLKIVAAQSDLLVAETESLPVIPTALQRKLSEAYYAAFGASYTIPFEDLPGFS